MTLDSNSMIFCMIFTSTGCLYLGFNSRVSVLNGVKLELEKSDKLCLLLNNSNEITESSSRFFA